MVFTAPIFLFSFFPLVLLLYFSVRSIACRNVILLVTSLAFYAWGEGRFFIVMVMSIVMNYFWGLHLTGEEPENKKKRWLVAAVASNLVILVFFKYAGFIVENLNFLLETLKFKPLHKPEVHLPAGVSFFTFHALSYLIDVYRGHFKAQRNPINLGLYIALFPQLIAGPIVRYEYIGPAIDERETTVDGFAYGVRRFVVGLGKKILIANSLSPIVDKIYGLPLSDVSTSLAWIAAVGYTLQIYFDFSGYSDMAIGMAKMFGFTFPENFNYPYVAKSITDFWRRWHISLSSWFRDYLYIPMGGNRVGPVRQYFNLFTVFFLCGLWHGASWSFVVWGVFHGVLLVAEKAYVLSALSRLPSWLARVYTLFAVLVSWIFFRADTLGYAWGMLLRLLGLQSGPGYRAPLQLVLANDVIFIFLIGFIGATPVVARLLRLIPSLKDEPKTLRSEGSPFIAGFSVAFLILVLFLSAIHIANNTFSAFIYYRF